VEGGGPSQGRREAIVVTSVPYAVERKTVLVEKIAEVIWQEAAAAWSTCATSRRRRARRPRAEEGRRPAAGDGVPLQAHAAADLNVQVNLTCLVPTDNPTMPRRALGLKRDALALPGLPLRRRHEAPRARAGASCEKRIHLLEGFEKVFDALDEIIKIIRKSDGKADAAEKIMKRFGLSEEQTDAILELKLYRLARLEILVVQKELGEKRAEAKRISALLEERQEALEADARRARGDAGDLRDKRRTKVILGGADEPEFQRRRTSSSTKTPT
jgi:DNA gyrase subunit A